MIRNAHGQIVTGEPVTDDAKAFYVSVLSPDSRQYRLALGPFNTKAKAEARVDDVRDYIAEKRYRDHHWYAYGTCGYTGDAPYPQGLFNEALLSVPA